MTSSGLFPNHFLLKLCYLIHLTWFCMPFSKVCIIFAMIIMLSQGNGTYMITMRL